MRALEGGDSRPILIHASIHHSARSEMATPKDIQAQSKFWWESNPMGYDWHHTLPFAEGTPEYFAAIDRRFFLSSPAYAGKKPFEQLIPFGRLQGRRVLEIGCGLGAHAQLLAEAGCQLTCVDLTERGVSMTQRRLALRGLIADVRRMDAEEIVFPADEFDFVWSWGVIHHSSNTQRIVQQVYRVLKPGGEFRVMVYHVRSFWAWLSYFRGVVSGKVFQGMSAQDILNRYTDGYRAQFYTKAEFTALLALCGFSRIETRALGQKSELLPIPGKGVSGRIKRALLAKFPDRLAGAMLSRVGSFLFAIARKDVPPSAA
jgi:2-polyprenyl-3-methyl-5-hydroxy-6-metoxy-1,4-benzoquinol methylase